MPARRYAELFQHLKVYILDLIGTVGGGSGPYAPSPHGLLSSHHTGNLADSQAPQFLKTDGSRQLIGNLSVADGITIDSVDISNFKSLYDIHIATAAATAHAGVGIHSHQSNAQGSKLDHGLALIGLLDDDHTQYAHAEGSGTRRAYEAGRLNLSVLAGDGLTGGGLMTQDRTLSIDFTRANTWTGTQTFTVAINAQGGINVGTATGASGGNIYASGVIHVDGTGNSYVMGNWGVKNNNPIEALDVTGNIQASGIININGTGNNYLAGNLGIGATSLSGKLHIAQGTEATLYVASPPSGYPAMYIGRVSSQPSIRGISDSDWLIIDAGTTGKAGLNYWSTGDVVLAKGGGKVGIGLDTTLSEKLQVSGGMKASGHLQIDGTDTSYIMGKLAVGRSSTTYKFDVAGTANIDTSLQVPLLNAPGALTINPTTDILLQPTSNLVKLMSSASIQSNGYASQTTGWRITYSGDADFRYLYADELHAKAFITDLEQALAGGQIISKSVAILAQDFVLPTAGNSATLYVKDLPSAPNMAVFQANDFVGLRQFNRANGSLTIRWAWGTVTNYVDQPDGTQAWTFTRSSTPGSATGTIYADELVLDFGISGNGFYEVNAIDGAYGDNSPYAQVVTWNTHPETQTVNARFGNLKGITNNLEYGLIAGTGVSTASQYIKLSNSAAEIHNVPINVYDSSTITINLDPSIPTFRVGANATSMTYSSGAGIWMGKDSSVYKARIGDPTAKNLTWDGSDLYLKSDVNNYLKFTGTSIQFYSANTKVIDITNTPTIVIGQVGTNQSNVQITSGAIYLRNNTANIVAISSDGELTISDTLGNQRIYVDTSGVLVKYNAYNYLAITSSDLSFWTGSSAATKVFSITNTPAITIGRYASGMTNIYITNSEINLRNYTTNLIKLTTSAITVGQVASGQSNIYISSGEIDLRNNTTNIIQLTSAGVLNINNPSGATVLRFASTGNFIDNILNVSGTGAAISIGATPPTSSTSGTGIWIDRTGLYSLANNVRQVWIEASSGKLYAGNGNVYFNTNGITFTTSSTYTTERTIKWGTNTKIAAYDYVNDSTLLIATNSSSQATYPTEITIAAMEGGYQRYKSNLTLAGLNASLYASNQVYIENAYGGLVINMANNKIDFQVGYNSKAYIDTNGLTLNETNLRKTVSSTTYTGYIYVPKQPPGTNTSWNGGAMNTGSYTLSASNFGAPNTAKALVVRIIARWGSASDTIYLAIKDTSGNYYISTRPYVANIRSDNTGIIPLDSSGQFVAEISGAATTLTYIYITGYFI